MSVKKLDQKGRWRNVIVAFRVSHEEDVRIDREVHLSGLSKQDFILRRLLNKEVVIQGNPKVYKALKDLVKFNYEHIYNKANSKEKIAYYDNMFNTLYYSYLEALEKHYVR